MKYEKWGFCEASSHLSAQKLNGSSGEKNSGETDITKQIALQHIHTLFRLAKENVHENPELAQRYAEIARKIAMKTNLRLPREYRRLICRHCKSFIFPGVNCRVRIQSRREPHMVVTCLKCGKHTRIPLKGRRKRR